MSVPVPSHINTFFKNSLEKYGKIYEGALLPSDVERGKLGNCFDKYHYVEGMVFSPQSKDWIHHAWLTDENNEHAFDPTWHAIDKRNNQEVPLTMMLYVGVKMPIKKVAEFIEATEYKAVFENYWRNEELASKCLVS